MNELYELLNFWYLFSIIAVILEVIAGFPLVFFFAGIASLITAGSVTLNLIEESDILTQVVIFLLLNIIWIPFFWQSFKKLFKVSNKVEFNNIIGRKVQVVEEFDKNNRRGKVKWSGTLFNAILDENSAVPKKGEFLEVIKIKGNKFIIKKEV